MHAVKIRGIAIHVIGQHFGWAWLSHTCPDESIRESIKSDKFVRADLPFAHHWARDVLKAMNDASAKKFRSAKRQATNGLRVCAASEKPILQDIVAAFDAEEMYVGDTGSLPLYLEFENPIPFFRCFEDDLESTWKGQF